MDVPRAAEIDHAWPAIVEGELASRARQVAHTIARALADQRALSLGEASDAVVYWAHTAAMFPERWAEQAYERAMQALADEIARGAPSLALFGGLTGAAWAASHIAGAPAGSEHEDSDELPPRVDAILVDTLSRPDWPGPYDLISGLVGFGVYFLARQGRGLARRGLELTVARLDALAQPAQGGVAWMTPPALLPAHHRREHPQGMFDLGLAHGVPGVLALYASVILARALPERDTQLRQCLNAAVRFIAANRHPEREHSMFDWRVAPGVPAHAARTAWCYGDLGIAVALVRAGRALQDDGLSDRALELARACATRPDDACGVHDAGLCHGAAGLGHVLNRLFHATGDEVLREGANRWFRRTLELQRPDALAGYPAFVPSLRPDQSGSWRASPGILGGAAGVGLALMSALGGSPDWDQPLLTDIGPRKA